MRYGVLAVLLGVFAIPAQAAEGDWDLSFRLGSSDLDGRHPNRITSNPVVASSDHSSEGSYSFAVSYQTPIKIGPSTVAVEASYTSYDEFSASSTTQDGSGIAYQATDRLDATAWALQAVWTYKLKQLGELELFSKAGLAWVDYDAKTTRRAVRVAGVFPINVSGTDVSDSDDGIELIWEVGAKYPITDNVFITGSYQRLDEVDGSPIETFQVGIGISF